jgi:hypothetical protein
LIGDGRLLDHVGSSRVPRPLNGRDPHRNRTDRWTTAGDAT